MSQGYPPPTDIHKKKRITFYKPAWWAFLSEHFEWQHQYFQQPDQSNKKISSVDWKKKGIWLIYSRKKMSVSINQYAVILFIDLYENRNISIRINLLIWLDWNENKHKYFPDKFKKKLFKFLRWSIMIFIHFWQDFFIFFSHIIIAVIVVLSCPNFFNKSLFFMIFLSFPFLFGLFYILESLN